MRDIKFRAFNKQCDCEACGGTFTSWERLLKISYTTNPDQPNNFFEDDGYALEQFTGLLDKNGKEIYEGDIVSGCNGSINGADWLVEPFEIGWHDRGFNVPMWVVKDNHDSTHWIEVIGNIHENPELREGLS